MTISKLAHALVPSACLLLLVLPPFAGARAESGSPWDQKAVTEIASQLHDTVKDLADVARTSASVTASNPRQDRARHQARDLMRKLGSATGRLVSELKAGKGAEETLEYVKRARMLANDTRELTRSAAINPETEAKLSAGAAQLAELEKYYAISSEGP